MIDTISPTTTPASPPSPATEQPAALAEVELGLVRVSEWPVDSILESPENEKLYGPIAPEDPEVVALAESIKTHGVQEPLVLTADGYILSGHRRKVAAVMAGLSKLPGRVDPVRRKQEPDRFLTLLREHNRQRIKGYDEKLREEIVSSDTTEKYRLVLEHREEAALVNTPTLYIRRRKDRCEITDAKVPFLTAVLRVLEKYREHWPLSVRRLHYYLLNDPPLKHASKPGSVYRNDLPSYKALDELTVRARLTGDLEWEAIDDETRPITTWNVRCDVQAFLRQVVGDFLKGYYRDLMQSQPNHIEIVAEKLTVRSVIKPVAARYRIPFVVCRGFASLPVRKKMAERFRYSGKEKLVLLILAEHDPDGEEIAHSFARSMRDDFDVPDVEAVKVALTHEHVKRFGLPVDNLTKAKRTSPNYRRFVRRFGDSAYELEAAVIEHLCAIAHSVPSSESQCRPLAKLRKPNPDGTDRPVIDLEKVGAVWQALAMAVVELDGFPAECRAAAKERQSAGGQHGGTIGGSGNKKPEKSSTKKVPAPVPEPFSTHDVRDELAARAGVSHGLIDVESTEHPARLG